MKYCTKCEQTKEHTDFYKTASYKDGLSVYCGSCSLKVSQEYYSKNREKYKENQKKRRATKEVCIAQMVYNAESRSKKKKLEFEIDKNLILELAEKQDWLCSVTGHQMSTETNTRKKANSFKVSIDSIDSNKGYLKDNIRLVCWAVNQMKSDKTDEEFQFWVNSLYKSFQQFT